MNDCVFTSKLIINALKAKQNLKKTPAQIEEIQAKKFKKLVNYAYQNSPYYKRVVDSKRINLNDPILTDFPAINKKIILENFDDFVTDRDIKLNDIKEYLNRPLTDERLFLDKYSVVNTSGSSGTIGYFIYSQNELAQGLCYSAIAHGTRLFQKLAYIGATKGRFAGMTMVSSAKRLKGLYKSVLIIDINDPWEDIVSKLNEFQPTVLSGYASIMPLLADLQQEGQLKINPKLIDISGEAIAAESQENIENVFKCPIINVYACSEHLFVGIGKKEYGGMYLLEDNFIVEINTKSTLITNLYNYNMPMIRYEMGDFFSLSSDRDSVLPYVKIENMVAREENSLILKNSAGRNEIIHPLSLIGLYGENISRFQFIASPDREKLTVKIVLNKEQSQNLESIEDFDQRLKVILEQKRLYNTIINYDFVDELPNDPQTGKFRMVV